MSIRPSPLKSAAVTEPVPAPMVSVGPAANPPLGWRSRTLTVPLLKFCVARSGRPSPLKSAATPYPGPGPVANGDPASTAKPLGPRRKTETLLPVPLTVATSRRPSPLKSAGTTPYGWAAPTASGAPSGANDACAGAVMNRAPSAAIPGRSLLMRASSTAGRAEAIDKACSTVEHGRKAPRQAPLDGSGEKVADPPQFCRVLQDFPDAASGGKGGSMCYCSDNQLLEPRPGGE